MSSINVNAISNEAGTGAPNFPNGLSVNSNPLPTAGSFGNRNRIINGAMVIDQRNAGAAVTVANTGTFAVDRWEMVESSDGVATAEQVQDVPTGFTNSVKWTTTTADTSLAAGQYCRACQIIEGYNTADLGWGSVSAKTITLSFWVRSSLTGTFAGGLRNSAGDRSYVFTYAISAADTWEYKTVTVAGDTSGTWLTDNGRGIWLIFDLGSGSDFQKTAGAWGAGNCWSTSGAVSVIGTLNATWYITGVQLEAGDTATPFEHRSYGQELALCQRYFCKTYNYETVPGTATSVGNLFNSLDATQSYGYTGPFTYPVSMRATPTIVVYNPNNGTAGQLAADSTNRSAVVHSAGSERCAIGVLNDSIGTSTYLRAHATASAEL